MTGSLPDGELGRFLGADMEQMGEGRFLPRGAKGVKFSMLRARSILDRAMALFGTDDFDRLFRCPRHGFCRACRSGSNPCRA